MKLTKERIDILAAALRKGVIIKHACIGAGICEKTYHNWQNEASDKELDPLDPEESLGAKILIATTFSGILCARPPGR